MISAQAFFTDTLNTVDQVIGTFVHTAYTSLVSSNSGVITAIFTLYVIFMGIKFQQRLMSAEMFMSMLIKMGIVYGLIMQWEIYNKIFFNTFTNEPGELAKVLISATGQMGGGDSVTQALDNLFNVIIKVSAGFLSQGGFSLSGFAFIFYAGLVLIIGLIMTAIALLLFIYAKIGISVALALGPIFIICLMFESTSGYFSKWINKLVTFALIPVVTSAVLALMLSIIDATLPQVNLPPQQAQFSGVIPFLCLSIVTGFMLAQVLPICSALGGGMTLAGLKKAGELVQNSFQNSGAQKLTEKVSNWASSQKESIKSSAARRKAENLKRMASEASSAGQGGE